MANLEILALDTATPQIRAPGAGDGYVANRAATFNQTVSIFHSLTNQVLSDLPTATFRRFSSTQTSNLLQLQTEANAALAAFDKDGKLTTPAVNLGVAGTTTGALTLSGSTSGTVTVQTAAAAGTYTLTLPTDDGNASQFLQTDGSGVLSWATAPVTAPGGSTTQIQFNNSGSFGGSSALTFNSTTPSITLAGGTVTTSNPLLDLTQTWNASGTTFTGLKLNVTNTASASASLLMDLQVGGSSKLNIDKNGTFVVNGALDINPSDSLARFRVYANGNITSRYFSVADSSGGALSLGLIYVVNGQSTVTLTSATRLYWSTDLVLCRRGAANLQLGAPDAAAPVAQTIGPQSVVAGTSNTTGANFTIRGSQGTGTGAGGSIIFQTAPAGSSGTAQNALVDALSVNSAGLVQFGGTTSSFPALKRSSTTLQVRLADDSGDAPLSASAVTAAQLTMSGNVSSAAWTTAGIGLASVARTFTDTTSSGTVAAAYTNVLGGNTVAASNSTTYTKYASLYLGAPVAGTNVTITNGYSLITAGGAEFGGNVTAPNLANGTTIRVFTPLDNQPPASNFATLDTRNSVAVLDFDAATSESATFVGFISQAATLTSGLTVRIRWSATSATSGDCIWGVQFAKLNGDNIDSYAYDTAATTTTTTSGTNGVINTTTVTVTTIDSLVAGDTFSLKVYRDAAAGGDTMTGDAELVVVEVRAA